MKPLFGGFFAYGGVLRRWGKPMMMADDVGGNRRWRGSGVPPARRGWCRGESRHATLRFAYRVTEECRRSATRECKPSDDIYNRSSAVVARALVSRGRRANPVLTYETALRRFFRLWRCIAPMGQSALRRFFAYGDGASCRNEVFVMRLFCVGFCKIGK